MEDILEEISQVVFPDKQESREETRKVQVALGKSLYKQASKKLIDEEKTWQSYLKECVQKLVQE